jgi:arginase
MVSFFSLSIKSLLTMLLFLHSFLSTSACSRISQHITPSPIPLIIIIIETALGLIPSSNTYELYKHTKEPHTVSIIGVPMTYGQPYVGTDYTPDLLRKGGLRSMLSKLSWRVEDHISDINIDKATQHYKSDTNPQYRDFSRSSSSFTGHAKNHIEVGCGCQLVAQTVYDKLQEGRFPLILGGDHSIGTGSLAGILKHRPDTGILWIDAHADINNPWISESGNMHGMPIGMLLEGNVDPTLGVAIPGFEWLYNEEGLKEYPRIKADSIIYVGLRDVDSEERRIIRENNITAYTMHDIDHYGIGQIMDMAFQQLYRNDSNRPIHISYDIDAVDPILAPATGTAVRGGLTFREAHYVAEAAARCGTLASAEIVELNPTLSSEGGANDTIELGLHLITSLMGKSII